MNPNLPRDLTSIADDLHRMVSAQYFDHMRQKLREAAEEIEAARACLHLYRTRIAAHWEPPYRPDNFKGVTVTSRWQKDKEALDAYDAVTRPGKGL